MLEKLFIYLSTATEGGVSLALSASFVWGILSLILSPCHLSSIPLIIGFVDEQGRISTRRAFYISVLFSSGLMISIAVIGIATAMAGRMMGDIGRYGNYFVGFILFLVGLHLIGVIPVPWSGTGRIGIKQKGLWAAFVLGTIFGIALGPCTFAYMAPMLSITFRLATTQVWYGAALLASYATGHCLIIILAGTFIGLVQQYLNWTEQSKGPLIVKKVCGILVIVGGFYLFYTTF